MVSESNLCDCVCIANVGFDYFYFYFSVSNNEHDDEVATTSVSAVCSNFVQKALNFSFWFFCIMLYSKLEFEFFAMFFKCSESFLSALCTLSTRLTW